MKKLNYLTLLAFAASVVATPFTLQAQEMDDQKKKEIRQAVKQAKNQAKGDDYRRSSLCLVMIEDPTMPKLDVIRDAFYSSKMPSKYNDHNVGSRRSFKVNDVKISEEDKAKFAAAVAAGAAAEAAAAKAAAEGTEAQATVSPTNANGGKLSSNMEQVAIQAYKFLLDEGFPLQMAKKWWVDEDGKCSTDLIYERGLVDASELMKADVATALDPRSMLEYAGSDLLNKSFVVASRFQFMSKEELVAEIDKMAQLIAAQFDNAYVAMAAKAAVLGLKAGLGDGYYVRATSHLFQWHWDEELKNAVYDNAWDNSEGWESIKDKFQLKYIGSEKGWANTKASIFSKMSEDDQVKNATVNAMAKVLSKLEKKYEVFKTKVPIEVQTVGEGKKASQVITAKIGTQEGLEAGDKYEVLEMLEDEVTGVVTYKKIGQIKVSKDKIWQNHHNADLELSMQGITQEIDATHFDGGKTKFYDGLLIRQLK